MKCRDPIEHLEGQGCESLNEGEKQTVYVSMDSVIT